MAFIKLTLIQAHNNLEENPDGEAVWINTDKISAMTREAVGHDRTIITNVLISNMPSEDGYLQVKEHPEEIFKLMSGPSIDPSKYIDD